MRSFSRPSLLVARIDGHAEEADVVVVEHVRIGEHGVDGGFSLRIAGGADKQHEDVAPADGVEGVARVAGGALMKPGGGIARLHGDIAARGVDGLVHGSNPAKCVNIAQMRRRINAASAPPRRRKRQLASASSDSWRGEACSPVWSVSGVG